MGIENSAWKNYVSWVTAWCKDLENRVEKITIDDLEFDLTDANDEAKAQLVNVQFVNEQILQRNNELQIAETAKIGYSRALRRELEEIGQDAKD